MRHQTRGLWEQHLEEAIEIKRLTNVVVPGANKGVITDISGSFTIDVDKKKYPDINCANDADFQNGASPYYTNSSQLPVNYTDDIFETLRLQDDLQAKYTGGTVLHIFLGEQVNDQETIKSMVRKIAAEIRASRPCCSPLMRNASIISAQPRPTNSPWAW